MGSPHPSRKAHRALLVTCEHASSHVPRRFAGLFQDSLGLLSTHRAYDLGAFGLARALSTRWECPVICGRVTRLLIDLNRSLGNRGLYSEFSRKLSSSDQHYLLTHYYLPYRHAVFRAVSELAQRGPLVHVSVHSFTPQLNGKIRNAEVGLLFDGARSREVKIAKALRSALLAVAPTLRVRFNYPYRGTSDGLAQSLRGWLPNELYAGLEVEFNQGQQRLWNGRVFQDALARAWATALNF